MRADPPPPPRVWPPLPLVGWWALAMHFEDTVLGPKGGGPPPQALAGGGQLVVKVKSLTPPAKLACMAQTVPHRPHPLWSSLLVGLHKHRIAYVSYTLCLGYIGWRYRGAQKALVCCRKGQLLSAYW